MKTFSKIIGVLITISLVVLLITILVGIFERHHLEDKILVSLLLIPCLLFLHFMYIHNFGFNLNSEFSKSTSNIILRLTYLSLFIIAIIPVGYLFTHIISKNNAKEMIDRGEKTIFNSELIADFKTKYDEGFFIILNIRKADKKKLNIKYEIFILQLLDKDGFEIKNYEITDYSHLLNENGDIYGINANLQLFYLGLEDYKKISSWEIGFK